MWFGRYSRSAKNPSQRLSRHFKPQALREYHGQARAIM
jgi:hypothetical protein